VENNQSQNTQSFGMLKAFVSPVSKIYMAFYHSIVKKEDLLDPVKSFQVQLLVLICLFTGFFMWSFAAITFLYVDDMMLRYLSIVYVLIHNFSLLCYRMTGKILRASYYIFFSGFFFIVHFSLLSGAFLTHSIIWLAIIPLIVGILSDRKHTVAWTGLVCLSVVLIYVGDIQYGLFENKISKEGQFVSQFFTIYGTIFLNGFLTLFFIKRSAVNSKSLRSQIISKEGLLHILVHDMANPISVISHHGHQLLNRHKKDGDTESDDFKRISQCTSSAKNIMDIVHAVRSIEAYESGKKPLILRPININVSIHNVLKILNTKITRKKINIVMNVEDDRLVSGIETVIEQQIVSNILTNAIKFSELNSEIKISINRYDEEFLKMSIRDYGIGIPEKLISYIFDPKFATSRSGTSGEEGTGFGMPIAFKAMKTLGGKITVQSWTDESVLEERGTQFDLLFKVGSEIVEKPPLNIART
jgi:signal transduction histidine kinase